MLARGANQTVQHFSRYTVTLKHIHQLKRMATTGLPPIHKDHSDSWHGKVAEGTAYPPRHGRYHLYIGLFCPFAHRANLVRHLKGLTDIIDVSIVKPYPKGNDQGWPGWKFDASYPNATPDKLFGSEYLHEVYFKADKDYKGKYSVPALWDTESGTMVCNESAEMLRWFQTSFNPLLGQEHAEVDLYPEHHRERIDKITAWLASDLNTGVYKAGFAPDQETYDKNVIPVFGALNKLEKLVAENGGPYVLGKELTELDILLYCTVIRFDVVYHEHFKCNLGSIRHSYPVLNNWMRHLYWDVKGFRETVDFKHIKENYTKSHPGINPKAITHMGPYPDVEEGFEKDFSKLKPGEIGLPAVLEHEKTLQT